MTNKSLFDILNEFDFGNGDYTFNSTYNALEEGSSDQLGTDSADASACVQELNLSYEIKARHHSTVVNGIRSTDLAEVEWRFWKE